MGMSVILLRESRDETVEGEAAVNVRGRRRVREEGRDRAVVMRYRGVTSSVVGRESVRRVMWVGVA